MKCYYDRFGNELFEGNLVSDGVSTQRLYRAADGGLGVRLYAWTESGKVCDCDYGVYPIKAGINHDLTLIGREV